MVGEQTEPLIIEYVVAANQKNDFWMPASKPLVYFEEREKIHLPKTGNTLM